MPSTPSDNFDFQNFYSTTLTSDITAGTLTIPVSQAPTPSEGILVIDPDSASPECIFYTSKGASSVTCPADGRGWESTTAAAHLSGTTVIMAPTAYQLRMLKTGSLFDAYATGWVNSTAPATVTCNGNRSYDLVISGVDLTDTLSAGMRLRTTRTSAAPTQCTSLNGTTQYYSKSSPAAMTFTDDFTVSAWIKLSSYAAGGIVARRDGTQGWSFFLNADGTIRLAGFNAGLANSSYVTSYQSVPLNKWVHVAAQLDMSTFTATTTTSYIMIDGVDVPAVVARAGTNPTALVQAGDLNVGAVAAASFFPGKIAQVAIYNAKVTQANIRATISQGLSGSETSLISAYSFNNTINDLNANANNLTAQGSAVATNADSPFGGQADGTISSTLDYAIIDAISFSTNTTITVRASEYGTIPTTGGVSAMSYSTQASPYGCPAFSNVIGQSLVLANTSIATNVLTDATGYTTTVYVPFGRKVKVSYLGQWQNLSAAATFGYIAIFEDSTAKQMALSTNGGAGSNISMAPSVTLTPTAGSHTYKIQAAVSSGTIVLEGGPTPTAAPVPGPSGIQVELI